MKRNAVVIAVVIMLVGIAVYKNFVQADEVVLPKEEAPKANYLAPAFTLETLEGQKLSVGGQRDKALLINFWVVLSM